MATLFTYHSLDVGRGVHPDWPEMKEPMTMAKGFEVLSRPIGEKGTRCRYTTTKAIALQPLSTERVSWPPIRMAGR